MGEVRLVMVVLATILFSGQAALAMQSPESVTQVPPRPESVYVTMPDGTRLAADVWLPQGHVVGASYPTVMRLTRYWRGVATDPPMAVAPPVVDAFNDMGFAFVLVDLRGSGASFGKRDIVFSTEETRDFPHLINWVAGQDWSNGAVATMGISYPGNTSEHASFNAPPALKAIVPRFTDYDWFSMILFPGGMQNKIITSEWGRDVRALDLNDASSFASNDPTVPVITGVRPADADVDGSLLAAAVEEHRANVFMEDLFGPVVFRDDIKEAGSLDDPDDHLVAIYRFRELAEQKAVPAFHWASFMDAGTAAGLIARFVSHDVPARYVIGPWSHGARKDTDPFSPADKPVAPGFDEQFRAIADFLEPLKSGETIRQEPELFFQTLGSGRWRKTQVWPPEGTEWTRFYLAQNNSLARDAAEVTAGQDAYTVDFDIGTGNTTRWSTQWGKRDVYYGDRAEADTRLLTYTSAPFEEDMEITGHPLVSLQMASSTPDGAVIAYLEDVSPDGVVTMLTEGELRLIHRKVSDDPPPFPQFGPYHSYLRKDALPMVPGEQAEVTFTMFPTSVVIRKGHAIRLAIAGHDKDTFIRVPADQTPEYRFYRGGQGLSYVNIPMQPYDESRLPQVTPFAAAGQAQP